MYILSKYFKNVYSYNTSTKSYFDPEFLINIP